MTTLLRELAVRILGALRPLLEAIDDQLTIDDEDDDSD